MNAPHHRKHSVLGKNRVEAFSDGVFAVAMTILVLNLQSPDFYRMIVGIHVQQTISVFLPELVVYILSFVIVGIYWVAHHNTFHYIKRVDRNLLWLNILLLICIVFIPFATALLGQYPGYRASILIYGSTLIVTGLALQLLWSYATVHHRLVDKNIDPQLVRRATRRNVMAPGIYLLAVLTSFLNLSISLIIFALVPIIYILPGRVDRHWHHEHVEHSQEEESEATGSVPEAGTPEHSPAPEKHQSHRAARRKKIAGKTFYERQIAALEKLDSSTLLEQYHPDATIAGFDFVVEGHDAIREHFEHYLGHLGTFKLKSTEKFVETPDAIFFEATMLTDHGEVRVYNIFLLHEDKATHHFTGVISSP